MGLGRRWLSEAVHSKMNQQDVGDSLDYGGGEEGNCHLPKNHQAGNKDNSSYFVGSVMGRKKEISS